jgi:hypothetical protein
MNVFDWMLLVAASGTVFLITVVLLIVLGVFG